MSGLTCECGFRIYDMDCPNHLKSYIIADDSLYDEDERYCPLDIMDHDNLPDCIKLSWQSLEMFECPECGRLAILSKDSGFKFYLPEKSEKKLLMPRLLGKIKWFEDRKSKGKRLYYF